MTKKKKAGRRRMYSLGFQMLAALVVGLALGVVTFFAVKIASDAYISTAYLSEERRKGREESYAAALQKYVDDQQLSSEDVSELADWAKNNRYLYIMVHKDDNLLFEWGGVIDEDKKDPEAGDGDVVFPDTGLGGELPTKEDLIAYAKEKDSHLIEMSDISVLVSMADYTEYFYYDFFNIASIVAAMVVLIIVVMLYFTRVTRRITSLAKEVAVVAGGDTAHSISASGSDEISQLSRDVEEMRNSILEKVEGERQALEANADLITSMSHDIRTPLTVLLGYLDIMKIKSKDEGLNEYIEASEKTALRLKKISDDLFGYFLVFGGKGGEVKPELYDGRTLFTQMLEEYYLLLTEQGYEIESDLEGRLFSKEGRIKIYTDAQMLMRIFGNLFSNIMKYADKTHPVRISTCIDGGRLTLKLYNKKLKEKAEVESNGIGTRTCRKLAEALDIGFEMDETEEDFTTTLTFSTRDGGEV